MNLGAGAGRAIMGSLPPFSWCAQITGLDTRYKYARRFLSFKRDYAQSNSIGSRGVRAIYMLEENKIYEVKDGSARYFCRICDWEIQRIPKSEVEIWLKEKN